MQIARNSLYLSRDVGQDEVSNRELQRLGNVGIFQRNKASLTNSSGFARSEGSLSRPALTRSVFNSAASIGRLLL